MCVLGLVKVGCVMLESLRKIGMIEMPKIKHTAKRSIDDSARSEAMRLLKRGDKVKDIVEKTGIHRSSVLRYLTELNQTNASIERY
tara:strand:- start:26000 stop:26257 length:258 start_codon:yes stop_codon:yes gene_type:complete